MNVGVYYGLDVMIYIFRHKSTFVIGLISAFFLIVGWLASDYTRLTSEDLIIDNGTLGEITLKNGHEIEWTIGSFVSLSSKENASYQSPEFRIWDASQWYFEIWPNGHTTHNSTGWISLYLHRTRSTSPVQVNVSFALQTGGETERIDPQLTWMFEDADVIGRPKFLRRSEMLSKIYWKTSTVVLMRRMDKKSSSDLETLSRNFTDMFISSRNYDLTLKVKGEEFRVHKFVLSARSSVFASMFEFDMMENKTETLVIEDFDPETFREFLLYLYSGKIEKVPSNAFELYKIADKYNVASLKTYCLLSIPSNLSMENFLDAIIFSNKFRISELELEIQNFFNENFWKIIQTPKWGAFLTENPSLANDMLQNLAERMRSIS